MKWTERMKVEVRRVYPSFLSKTVICFISFEFQSFGWSIGTKNRKRWLRRNKREIRLKRRSSNPISQCMGYLYVASSSSQTISSTSSFSIKCAIELWDFIGKPIRLLSNELDTSIQIAQSSKETTPNFHFYFPLKVPIMSLVVFFNGNFT